MKCLAFVVFVLVVSLFFGGCAGPSTVVVPSYEVNVCELGDGVMLEVISGGGSGFGELSTERVDTRLQELFRDDTIEVLKVNTIYDRGFLVTAEVYYVEVAK